MKFLLNTATAVALALPGLAAAETVTAGDLQITDARIFETAPTAKAGGGYATITNPGDSADALIDVAADFPKVELHESYEEDGVMKMQHVERLEIPAGGSAELAPGGYHVMFMGLSEPFEQGDEIPVTLSFETAGDVEVIFHVVERKAEH